jgi:carboxyl-terminal processing protease
MTARVKFSIISCSVLLTAVLIVGGVMGQEPATEGAYRPLQVYSDVLRNIKSNYVENPDMSKVTLGALQGLVEYLDPLSSYLTAEQFKQVISARENPDLGTGLSTGLVVHKRTGHTTVLAVLPGSSAEGAGVWPGDLVEAIDGLSTRVMPPAYLHALLSGKPGTNVKVLLRSLRDSDEPKEHLLIREQVELPRVSRKILEPGIGYIDLDVVDRDRVTEVAVAVRALQAKGAKKIILDLRGNSVGQVQAGIPLVNLFLSRGAIVSLKGRQHSEERFEADVDSTVTDVPLALISDRTTAGSAELVAAALLDNERAQLVGERTYGLAALQKTIKLKDGAALILSVAKYHRPTGEALQDGGVTPSHPLSSEELRRYYKLRYPADMSLSPSLRLSQPGVNSVEKDPYIQKALEVLKESTTSAKKAA